MPSFELMLAKTAGFCFGVSRAIAMTKQLAESSGRQVCTLGPIIHNEHVVRELEEMGVRVCADESEIEQGQIAVIRTHGVPENVEKALFARGAEVADATCPFVSKIHRQVANASRQGQDIMVIGAREHPEVIGICGHAKNVVVIENLEELKRFDAENPNKRERPMLVVAQTTLNVSEWEKCAKYIKKIYTNASISDTICNATFERQREAAEIAARANIFIVLGSALSSNTKKLFEIGKSRCKNTFLVENPGALPLKEITELCRSRGKIIVGLTAGASTPAYVIKEAIGKMDELKNGMEAAPEDSFEAMLDESLITLNTGDRVRGTVIGITPTEVQVQLGTKQAAYIPASELSGGSGAALEDLVKVGDEIEVFVTRVNDVEGVITLSKKKVDSIRGFEEVEQAFKDKTVLEGIFTDAVKGGAIINYKGVRIFVPASHCPIKRDESPEQLVGTTHKFVVIEFERRKNKIIGSVRNVKREERRLSQEKFWETAEVGKRYNGVVKSLTNYGAFVDIGGIDGMVHISELAWSKIKHPAIVVKPGDEIEVYIKEMDKEKNRISLGYKDLHENPWKILEQNYKVGDVIKVKIARLVPFGAFAEILPGVDGLIHISQIANRRTERPADELSVGQEVDVKITGIDLENMKLSLSIRALLAPQDEESQENAELPGQNKETEEAAVSAVSEEAEASEKTQEEQA